MNQQKEGFDRLLSDMEEDAFQAELEANKIELRNKLENKDLQFLRKKLQRRFKHNRMSPSMMYMPRIALTFAIVMTCAVSIIYIKRLKQNTLPKTPPKTNIDSLMRKRKQ